LITAPRAVKQHQALAVGGGLVLLLVIAGFADSGRAPWGVMLQGAVLGTANGLLALGLVLTYRSDRIVNFAYGAMGGVGGGVGVLLYTAQHWSYPVCIVLGLAAGAAVGALTELLVIRRFVRASRLILTVATIGLAQVLGGIQLLLPKWIGGTTLLGGFTTPLSGHGLNIGSVLFTGDDLLTVVAVPIAITGLAWFLLRTDSGIAVRAVADNRDRALLLGIPVRRLATIVWALAGLLAALAVILPAPTQGLTIDAAAGPTLLLPALAAAVIARMESLPIAVTAGIGLGIMNSLVGWNFNKQSVTTVAFFIIILLALVLNRAPSGRRDGAEESSLASAGSRLREIPTAMQRLPEVVAVRVGGPIALLAAAIIIPLSCSPSTIRLFSIAAIYGIVAVSLVVLSGWAGQVSLGQYAFVGLGAVLVGNLMNRYNLDFFVCLVAAGAAGALLAVLVGLPALRMQGLFLAVTTLALAVTVDAFFLNPVNFNSLIPNTIQRPVLWKRFDLTSERDLYYLCLGVLVLTVVIVHGLRKARAGRVMLATRENPRAAAAMAVPTTRVKLVGFVTSGAIAGIAGGLHATILQSVGFGTYQPSESLLVFSMLIIGGADSIGGALLGVALVELAVHAFPQYQLLITGTGLLVILLVLPGGLSTAAYAVRDRALGVVARRRNIDLSIGADGTVGPAAAAEERAATVPSAEPQPTDRMLTCHNVEARYGAMQVLFGVDLDVADGEVVALLGTNGAGKSTMLKAVAGLLNPGPGKVWFEGRDITGLTPQQRVAAGLVLMPAKSIFPSLTVAENLRISGWLGRDEQAEVDAVRQRVLDLFPHLAERMGQAAGTMSGGQQQMLSLGMALLTRPRLLLIDELSLGLAPAIVARMLEVVGELVAEGMTTVIVEQSVNVALEVAERAVFLERGSVRFTGQTSDLLNRPDVLRSVFITGATPAPEQNGGRAKTRAKAKAVPAPTMDLMAQAPVLECQAISKNFGAVRVLNDIDLTVHNGEILGLIGHNGAGKTTLFDVMCGFLPSDRGHVILDGVNVTSSTPSDRAFLGLGRSFQEARLFPALTVAETVAVALERHLESKDLVAAALRLPASTLSEYTVNERVGELLSQVGLSRYARSPIGELSTGTRRIVELACVLAQEPSVVLLDEPTAGVAQKETEALAPLLKRVRADTGCTMVVIDHDMPLLTGLCDRLVALELGQVIASGPPATVLEDRRVIESYLGVETATIERSGNRPAASKPPAKSKPKPKPKAAASTRR
jgi:ABC-type branched-subunit amino acid transport system ATPase component/ABC-type branched-subunit amino acid transport system permease subunit